MLIFKIFLLRQSDEKLSDFDESNRLCLLEEQDVNNMCDILHCIGILMAFKVCE